MAEELDVDSIFKLKVDGLKQELGERGLSKTGSKAELQTRLLSFVTTHDGSAILKSDDNEGLDDNSTEDEELKKEIEESLNNLDTPTATGDESHTTFPGNTTPETAAAKENEVAESVAASTIEDATNHNEQSKTRVEKAVEKKIKIIKPAVQTPKAISLKLTEEERRDNRSKRFGGAVSTVDKKKSRTERFSSSSISGLGKADPLTVGDKEKISKRAERFGAISSVLTQASEIDRLKQRQERFVDNKIKKRQERFGVVQATTASNTDKETRKLQRAIKFGIK